MDIKTQAGFQYNTSTMTSIFEKNGAKIYQRKDKIIFTLKDKRLYDLVNMLE